MNTSSTTTRAEIEALEADSLRMLADARAERNEPRTLAEMVLGAPVALVLVGMLGAGALLLEALGACATILGFSA